MKYAKVDPVVLLPVLALVLCGVMVYANTFDASFHLDDRPNIVHNPLIQDTRLFLDHAQFCAQVIPGSYEELVCVFFPRRYVGYLSFALNYIVHGLDVVGYHAVNLAVHCANAMFMYALVLLTFGTPGMKGSVGSPKLVATFSALLFIVHPVQTQAVTYIVQRFTSLATLFYLASLLCYVWSRLSDSKTRQYLFYGLSLVSALFAMKTKEIAFTLPLAIALYEVVFFEGRPAPRLLRLVPFLLTLCLIPLSLTGTATFASNMSGGLGGGLRVYTDMSRAEYFITQMRVIATYLRLLVLPIGQNLDYDYPIYRSLTDTEVVAACALHAALLAVGLLLLARLRQGRSELRLVGFGIIWFYLALSVESSVIPIVDVIFEHRLYLPSVGVCIAAAVLVSLLRDRLRQKEVLLEKTVAPMSACLIIVLAVAAFERNRVWRDEITLWTDVVQKSPLKARGHNNLAIAYSDHGLSAQALAHYEAAVRLNPDYAEARNNLGNSYLRFGLTDKAIEQYHAALLLKPPFLAEINSNLGNAYTQQGMISKAMEHYQAALRLKPDFGVQNNLGNAYLRLGFVEKAIEHYQAAVQLNPDFAEGHTNLAKVYVQEGLIDKAIEHSKIALRLKPDYAEARALFDLLSAKNRSKDGNHLGR